MPLFKVILRDINLEDVEHRYEWALDKEVTKYLNIPNKYPPFTREETENWIKLCMTHENGYYQKTILSENNKPIGWVDLKNFDNTNKNAELGIAIGDRDYWSRGYGVAAIKAMLNVGFEEFGLEKIWLRVDSDNVKAIKCYEKCGFVKEGIMRKDRLRRGEFIDRYRMSILKEEIYI